MPSLAEIRAQEGRPRLPDSLRVVAPAEATVQDPFSTLRETNLPADITFHPVVRQAMLEERSRRRNPIQEVYSNAERVMSALPWSSHLAAGVAEGLLEGERDPRRLARWGTEIGMREGRSFMDLARERTPDVEVPSLVPGGSVRLPLRAGLGLAGFGADLATDLSMYLGGPGLTRAGTMVKDAETGLELARSSAAIARRPAEVASAVSELQRAGSALQRARLALTEEGGTGRTLASVAGHGLPASVTEPIFSLFEGARNYGGITEPEQTLLGGMDKFKREMGRMLLSAGRRAPETARAMSMTARAAGPVATARAWQDFVPEVERNKQTFEALGITPEIGDEALTHAAETSRAHRLDEPFQLQPYLTPSEWRTWRRTSYVQPADRKAAEAIWYKLQGIAQRRADEQAFSNAVLGASRLYGFEGKDLARFSGDVRQLVGTINARNSAMMARKAEAGVRAPELMDDFEYLSRHLTDEARQAMQDAAEEMGVSPRGLTARQFTEKHGAQIMRDLRMPVREAEILARTGKLRSLGGRKVKQLFVSNPWVAQAMHEGEGERAIASADFLKRASHTYALPKKDAPRGWRPVAHDIGGLDPSLRYPPEVADLLENHFRGANNLPWAARKLRRFNQIWKAYTVPIIPVSQNRNALGDFWNYGVVGGLEPDDFASAVRAIIGRTGLARGKAAPTIEIGGVHHAAEDLLREAENVGAVDGGVTQELNDAVTALYGNKLPQSIDNNTALRFANRFARARENAMRFGLYISRRRRGEVPELAALHVKKYGFDYSDLPNALGHVRDVAIPFLAWTYFNVPLQLEALASKPGVFSAVQHLREAAAGQQPMGLEDQPLPEFLGRSLPMRMGGGEDNPVFWRLEGTWPGADINQSLDPGYGAWRLGVQGISPLLSAPVESAANVDLFRSQPGHMVPLYDRWTQPTAFLGTNFIPRGMMPFVESARVLTEANRLMGGSRAEYPPAPLPVRAAAAMLGRPYSVDEQAQWMRFQRAQKSELDYIESQIKFWSERGNQPQAEFWRRRREALIEHPETTDMSGRYAR